MTNFCYDEPVYWNNKSFTYMGQVEECSSTSHVVDSNTGKVEIITTALLSREPKLSQRELNGKALYELWGSKWDEVVGVGNTINATWGDNLPPDSQEVYMRLAETLNYKADEQRE
jgi:hypothetical protein